MKSLFVPFLVPEEKYHDFALWAFGEGYEKLSPNSLRKAWNTLHSGKLNLRIDGEPNKDRHKMVELWEKERQQAN